MARKARLLGLWENLRDCWRTYRRGLAEQVGQTLAEYTLILSVIALTVVVSAALLLRHDIVGAFNDVADCFQGACFESRDHCDDGHGRDGSQVPCS